VRCATAVGRASAAEVRRRRGDVCGHAGASPRALAAAQERNDDVGGVNSAARQQGGGRQQPGPSGTLDLLERWILAGTLAGTKTRRSRSPHCLSVMSSVSHIQSKHQSCQCQKAQHASKVLHCSLLTASCFTASLDKRPARGTPRTGPIPPHQCQCTLNQPTALKWQVQRGLQTPPRRSPRSRRSRA
jgi:hypothetical protein